jgi:hypothetical protein
MSKKSAISESVDSLKEYKRIYKETVGKVIPSVNSEVSLAVNNYADKVEIIPSITKPKET